MSEEEKKAIEELEEFIEDDEIENISVFTAKKIKNIIDNQQKEIERLNGIINSRYYHYLKCRELEKEINENWEDKIRELEEKVKKEKTGNPYDFIYMLDEILEENTNE